MSVVNLGKIGINVIDAPHALANTYKRLDVVQDGTTGVWFISHAYDVPTNINLTDQSYWKVFFDGVANDSQVAQNTTDIATLGTQKMDVHTHPYALESSVSVARRANTIVKRNPAGDVVARLFRPEYSTLALNSNYFSVQHEIGVGVDNYVRPRSISQVRADLGVRTYTYQIRGAFGNARIHYIYPPTGYDMSHLTACSVWVSLLHMNSTTLNANLDVTYEGTRIRIDTHLYIFGVGYHTAWEKV